MLRFVGIASVCAAFVVAAVPAQAMGPGACAHVLTDREQLCVLELDGGIRTIEYGAVATAGAFALQVLDDEDVLVWQIRCEPAASPEGNCQVEDGPSEWSMWLYGESAHPAPGVRSGGHTTFLPGGGSIWFSASAGSGVVTLHTDLH